VIFVYGFFSKKPFCHHTLQIFADKYLDFREDSECYMKVLHTKEHRELGPCPYSARIVKRRKLVFTDQLDGMGEARNVYGKCRSKFIGMPR
jgi:hypothetical protein